MREEKGEIWDSTRSWGFRRGRKHSKLSLKRQRLRHPALMSTKTVIGGFTDPGKLSLRKTLSRLFLINATPLPPHTNCKLSEQKNTNFQSVPHKIYIDSQQKNGSISLEWCLQSNAGKGKWSLKKRWVLCYSGCSNHWAQGPACCSSSVCLWHSPSLKKTENNPT